MLRIKYNNEFIDISASSEQELEANSPLFLVDNVLAEYSTPITIVYTNKNVRLLGPLFFSLSVKKKAKFAVEILKGNTYRCNATLVIESAAINSSPRNNNASGYLLTGLSSFFSEINGKRLQDLELGEFTKPFTTAAPYDNSAGYWQAFQESWQGLMEFIVAPVRNDNIYNDTGSPTTFMNPIGRIVTGEEPERTWGQPSNPFGGYYNTNYNNSNEGNGFTYSDFNTLAAPFAPVFPMLFLKAAFTRIFTACGWSLDSSLIEADWSKLVVFSNFKVDTYVFPQGGQYGIPHGSKATISFKYSDLLPKNTAVSSFILAICKRYGWVPLMETGTKICQLFPLKNIEEGALKDWTRYAEQQYSSDFSEDEKLYSFKNNFTGNDSLTSEQDISQLEQSIIVNSKFELPPAADIYDNSAVFCVLENTFYGIIVNENNVRAWAPVKDNIYSDDKENATGTVETDCTTLATTWSQYTGGGVSAAIKYYGLFPYCAQPFSLEGGIRTLFYHGLVQESLADGTPGQTTYPFMSATRSLQDGSKSTGWSNVFKAPETDGKEYGIEEYWYKKWLQYMQYAEVKTQVFNLPLTELANYRWTDRILINNIPHLIVSFIEKLAQNNFIQAKIKRLYIESAGSGGGSSSSGIYLQLTIINLAHYDTYLQNTEWKNVFTGTLLLSCYSDAAGSIPLTPPATVFAKYQAYSQLGALSYVKQGEEELLALQSSSQTFYNDLIVSGNVDPFNVPFNYKYLLVPDPAFTIIP